MATSRVPPKVAARRQTSGGSGVRKYAASAPGGQATAPSPGTRPHVPPVRGEIAAPRVRKLWMNRLGRERAAVTIAIGAVTLAGLSDLRRCRHMRRMQRRDPRAREQR